MAADVPKHRGSFCAIGSWRVIATSVMGESSFATRSSVPSW